jgi:predicted ribosome quality control (RQC) complex YloA/Tae2 family protein
MISEKRIVLDEWLRYSQKKMPVITRFQLKNANAMRDHRARVRSIIRDKIVDARPVCTLEISQYSESSDDDTDSVCSDTGSLFPCETDSDYTPESDDEASREDAIDLLLEKCMTLAHDIQAKKDELDKRIEEQDEKEKALEKRIEEQEAKPVESRCAFPLRIMLFVAFMSWVTYVVDTYKYDATFSYWRS